MVNTVVPIKDLPEQIPKKVINNELYLHYCTYSNKIFTYLCVKA